MADGGGTDGDHAARLAPKQVRLVQSLADFQMALSAFDFMCELDEDSTISRIDRRRFRCFEDAAVIAYGRAFSSANGLPSLDFKHLGIRPSSEERALHDRLMERRHKVVAHSDADRQRIMFVTSKVDADIDIMMPHMDFDDALEFYVDRWRLIKWLRRLIFSAGKVLFQEVQGAPPIRFLRDHSQ